MKRLALLALLVVLACGGGAAQPFGFRSPVGSPIGSPIASQGSAPTSVLYQGQALGNFSNTNTVSTSTGTTVAFGPGQTLWLTIQTLGIPPATEVVLSSSQGPYTTGAGWRVARSSSTGVLFFLSAPSYFQQLNVVPPAYGVTTYCIVWRASDGLIQYAAGGGALANGGIKYPSPVAPDGASATFIGSPNGDGSAAGVSTRMLAWATWNSEATDSQCRANTFTTGNRFGLSAAVRASAVVDSQPSRDWHGGSTFATLGSSPVTFHVAGSPALVRVDERRYPTAPWYRDTSTAIPQVDGGGYAFTIHDSYAWVEAKTDARSVAVEAYTTETGTIIAPDGAPVGVLVNGAFSSAPTPAPAGYPNLIDAQLAAGSGKVVAITEGTLRYASAPPLPATGLQGSFVAAVRLPVYATDGATLANSVMVAPVPVQKKLVLVGDSILAGWDATPLQQNGVVALLRSDFPTSGTGGVSAFCIGTQALANYHAIDATFATTVAQIVKLANGTSSNVIWIALGTNDYGGGFISAATFGTYMGAFLDALHSALVAAGTPGVSIYVQSPIQRIAPSGETANGLGDTLGAYRASEQTAVASRVWATYVEGAAGAIVSNGNYFTDGLHLNAAGDAQYKAFLKTTLAY